MRTNTTCWNRNILHGKDSLQYGGNFNKHDCSYQQKDTFYFPLTEKPHHFKLKIRHNQMKSGLSYN